MTAWSVLGTVAVVGLLVCAVTVLARARARSVPPVGAPAPTAVEPEASTVDRLVQGLLGVHDLADGNVAVRSQIRSVLRQAGVEMITAEPGCPFDPAWQTVVDRQVGDEEQRGTVSRIVRPGWLRGGSVLRPMEVVLWTS